MNDIYYNDLKNANSNLADLGTESLSEELSSHITTLISEVEFMLVRYEEVCEERVELEEERDTLSAQLLEINEV